MDPQLKTAITSDGHLPDGLEIHAFQYLEAPDMFLGVMAQDILARDDLAHAVIPDASGFLTVDYATLGIWFQDGSEMAEAGQRAIAHAIDLK